MDEKHSYMMQALSHFSYHKSGGSYVLCDLQGGTNGDSVILTDPALLSRDGRFGPTDLGSNGLLQFFYHHKCNGWCKDEWSRPRIPTLLAQRFARTPAKQGTSMLFSSRDNVRGVHDRSASRTVEYALGAYRVFEGIREESEDDSDDYWSHY